MDLRVGQIVEIRAHKTSKELKVEKVDVEESEACTVVADLPDAYTVNKLKGMNVEVVCNLVTANAGTVESEGMNLAGEKKVSKVLSADKGACQFDKEEMWCSKLTGDHEMTTSDRFKFFTPFKAATEQIRAAAS